MFAEKTLTHQCFFEGSAARAARAARAACSSRGTLLRKAPNKTSVHYSWVGSSRQITLATLRKNWKNTYTQTNKLPQGCVTVYSSSQKDQRTNFGIGLRTSESRQIDELRVDLLVGFEMKWSAESQIPLLSWSSPRRKKLFGKDSRRLLEVC